MTGIGVVQIAIFLGLILVCAKPLGDFMARLFEGERAFLHPVLRWLEALTYKVAGIREDVEQRWTHYTASLLSFSIFGFLLTYLIQRAQGFLPFNPQHFNAGNVPPDLAESTLSYFVQMAVLTVQNFASASAGMAIAVAVIRGFARPHGPFFVGLLVGTVVIVGVLTFFPALSLGPIVEHYRMQGGKLFSMILLPLQEIWS